MKDRSLVFFTLIGQSAVGVYLSFAGSRLGCALQGISTKELDHFLRLEIASFILITIALLASTAHLGSPGRVYRAILNIRQSWLSREIFFALLFTAISGLRILYQGFTSTFSPLATLLHVIAVMSGGAFIFSMARLYMLRTVSYWRSIQTLVSFVLTTLSLGTLISSLMLSISSASISDPHQSVSNTLARCAALLIALQVINQIHCRSRIPHSNSIQPGKRIMTTPLMHRFAWYILFALMACTTITGAVLISYSHLYSQLISLALILSLLAEIDNRIAFYQSYERIGL